VWAGHKTDESGWKSFSSISTYSLWIQVRNARVRSVKLLVKNRVVVVESCCAARMWKPPKSIIPLGVDPTKAQYMRRWPT
jgi:hypothetical protein